MTDHLGDPTSPTDDAKPMALDTAFSRTKGLYVAQTGDVAVVMAKTGATQVFPNIQAGTFAPIACTQVNTTGTTVTSPTTNIVLLY